MVLSWCGGEISDASVKTPCTYEVFELERLALCTVSGGK
jgi:hypothetical protein